MSILFLSTIGAGIGICFGTVLLIFACAALHSPLPLIGLFVGSYMIVWKLDKDDEKRMRIKYKLQKVVKRHMPSN